MVCSICRNTDLVDKNTTNPDNPLTACDSCGVNVHELCYGIIDFDDVWRCSWCSDNEGSTKKCVLCPSTKGALKRTTDGRYVHVICAMYHPDSVIEDAELMEPVDLSKIAGAKLKKKCSKCFDIGGCVPCCAKRKCYNFIHATCAQELQYLREVETDDRLDFKTFCKKHGEALLTKRRTLTGTRIKRALQERQSERFIIKAKEKNSEWILDRIYKPRGSDTEKSGQLLLTKTNNGGDSKNKRNKAKSSKKPENKDDVRVDKNKKYILFNTDKFNVLLSKE